MTSEERENLSWAIALVRSVRDFEQSISVVDFYGEKTLGVYRSTDIRLAKRLLDNRKELIATLVHEVAHREGSDGAVGHEREIESIFSDIVCSL